MTTTNSKLKPRQIMLSKRANIFYLEKVRVLQKDHRIVYLTDRGEDVEFYFNIPEKNTALVLLGKGSSITDAAVRAMAESNVLVGFCGTGGTPLHGLVEPVFITPQSEYRPTEYMQHWAQKWFNEPTRLEMGKTLLKERINLATSVWKEPRVNERIVNRFMSAIEKASSTQDLLSAEAVWVKALYREQAKHWGVDNFERKARPEDKKDTNDTAERTKVNGFLTHGNYLSYGLAAVALNGLGISYAFPLLHGKTRRGALVFDVADVIKDAYVLPLAFECGVNRRLKDRDYRSRLISLFQKTGALDYLFDMTKTLALKNL